MSEIALIVPRKPHTFVVMSITVRFGGLTIQHRLTDVFPNITTPVTFIVWIHSRLQTPGINVGVKE